MNRPCTLLDIVYRIIPISMTEQLDDIVYVRFLFTQKNLIYYSVQFCRSFRQIFAFSAFPQLKCSCLSLWLPQPFTFFFFSFQYLLWYRGQCDRCFSTGSECKSTNHCAEALWLVWPDCTIVYTCICQRFHSCFSICSWEALSLLYSAFSRFCY